MLLGFPFCGRLQEPKNPRIATEVLRHQRQHDGRSRTSQQSPSGGMCQAQRTANGDLKKCMVVVILLLWTITFYRQKHLFLLGLLDTEFVGGMLVLYNQPFNWRFLFPNPSSCEVSLKSCVKSPGLSFLSR